jgi:hypothetical protein
MKHLPVTLKLNPQLQEYLGILRESGIFGDSLEEVCERLICQRVEALAGNGCLSEELRAAIRIHTP